MIQNELANTSLDSTQKMLKHTTQQEQHSHKIINHIYTPEDFLKDERDDSKIIK